MSRGTHLLIAALSYVASVGCIAKASFADEEFDAGYIVSMFILLIIGMGHFTLYWFHERIYRNGR